MADLTHDISDDAFHEIHLSGKQLVFLFMATTVVSVVIFLCGVFVGRGVPAQREAQDSLMDPTVSAAAPEPAAAPAPVQRADRVAAEPPAPADETDRAADGLSYKGRLEGSGPVESSAGPVRTAPPAAAPVSPPASSRAAAPAPAPAPPAPAPETVAGTARPGVWVVQVHALRDRNAANGIVRRLAAKGYPAFLVASGPPTGSYKVQVGRFKDRSEAERIVARLKKEEQFNSWITR